MHFNFTDVLSLQYLNQNVSASIPAGIFRVISLMKEYNCNLMCGVILTL
jgi:hypothetical protein